MTSRDTLADDPCARRGVLGRADLLRILARREDAASALREAPGYVEVPRREVSGAEGAGEVQLLLDGVPREPDTRVPPTAFLRVVRVSWNEADPEPAAPPPLQRDRDAVEPLEPAALASRGEHQRQAPPVAPRVYDWSEVGPRVLRALGYAPGLGRVDVRRLVDKVARAEAFCRPPTRPRRASPRVWLLADRSAHLASVFADQVALYVQLRALLGESLEPVFLPDGPSGRGMGRDKRSFTVGDVEEGDVALVLSDLGAHGGAEPAAWQAFGSRLAARGARALALRFPGPLRPPTAFETIDWFHAPPVTAQGLGGVLDRLAFASERQPGLVRAIRAGLPRALYSPRLELVVPRATRDDGPEVLGARRARFSALDEPEQRRVVSLQRAWRGHRPPEVWHAEVLALHRAGLGQLVEAAEWQAARTFFLRLAATAERGDVAPESQIAVASWFWDVQSRLTEDAGALDETLSTALSRLWELSRLKLDALRAPDEVGRAAEAPPWLRPTEPPPVDVEPTTHHIRSVAGALCIAPAGTTRAGSWVADCVARGPSLWALELDPAPSWAAEAGRDPYGRWARVEVEGVSFVMRWIEPGTFWMGSPEEEVGRYPDEGPRHRVTLTEGFWLAEAPCTQALWQAIMGKNPSAFKSPTRPVERVSWDEVLGFVDAVNARCPGLELSLPTEAQWEYACRAGTDEATYVGALDGGGRAPVLDTVAWYGGNSDTSFELKNGQSTYLGVENAGTHPVKGKAPNAWGLYDMLGNVNEWCADTASAAGKQRYGRTYLAAEAVDPLHEAADTRPFRIFRGGSWHAVARLCRAAYRYADHRKYRYDSLGFRVARGRAPGGAKPEEPARATPAGPRGTSETAPRGAAHVHLGASVRLPVDFSRTVELRTDLMSLTLEPLERPAWAHRLARDRFGLFVDVEVEPKEKSVLPASFRMRWIPPGRFWMGSPDEEVGRDPREGPRHQVVWTEGFWLADSPCTQDLWVAVLGKDANTSTFRSPCRPVETVSWEDVTGFLERLNTMRPDLGLRLPKEAEWEYACRAGTNEATYVGELHGSERSQNLDPIAWYGGNSDQDMDLDGGYSTVLQLENAGSHPVKAKAPNPWGLYDMLGNVFEWCWDGADDWDGNGYEDGPAVDPQVKPAGHLGRIVRGGSWRARAKYLRAACRNARHQAVRLHILGFRVARGSTLGRS